MLSTPEDKLLFILAYQKTYPLQTMHGLQFGLSQTQSLYWIHRLTPLLQRMLTELALEPASNGQHLSHSEPLQETPAHLLLDGTERRVERPQDAEAQTAHYGGKKKTRTDKKLVLVDTTATKSSISVPPLSAKPTTR
jgi:hypothetical protein